MNDSQGRARSEHEAHHARQLRGDAAYLVAWRDTTPLGSVVLRRDGYTGERGRAAHPESVEICHLQVREEHRGQGVGTALIAAAEHEALRHGHRVVAMGAADDSPGALRRTSGWGTAPQGSWTSPSTTGWARMAWSTTPASTTSCC